MTELQAALEFQVELSKFYNVDLFQRGYYQIRTSLKSSPKAPVKIEVSLPKNNNCDLIFPASVINGVAVSKTFQILYRNEDVSVDDIILFKVQMLVDTQKIEESMEQADFQLNVDLWFTEEEVGPEYQDKLQCVSQRVLKLHLDPNQGLHHHLPVLFDYFHLSVICVTVHATLLAVHQPYVSFPGRPPKTAWQNDQHSLESIYFTTITRPSSGFSSIDRRLREACQVHKVICQVLLSAYESLQTSFESLSTKLPLYCKKVKLEPIDCHKKLELILEVLQNFNSEEEFLETAQSDVAQLCAENVILWNQYLEMFTLVEKVTHHLAKEHHLQRVKRFSEGFFTYEYTKSAAISCFEPSLHGHSDLATIVRNSQYFQHIPPLAVECAEMDGEFNSTPIVFEDVYSEFHPVKLFKSAVDSSPEQSPVVLRDQRTHRNSRSDQSSNFSDESSPKFKRASKFNLIKNRKLDTIKRPSAQATPNSGVTTNVAGMNPTGATLVGYKKMNSDTTLPIVELGTLSPVPPLSAKRFTTIAASMPALPGSNVSHLNLSGSMPDLCRTSSLKDSSAKLDLFRATHSINEAGVAMVSEGRDRSVTLPSQFDSNNSNQGKSSGGIHDLEKITPINLSSSSDSSLGGDAIQNGSFQSGYSEEKILPNAATKDITTNNANAINSRNQASALPHDKNTDSELLSSKGQLSQLSTLGAGDSGYSGSTEGSSSLDKPRETAEDSGVGSSMSDIGAAAAGSITSSSTTVVSNVTVDVVKRREVESSPVKSSDSDNYLSGECTLLELLEEEYERSQRDNKKSLGESVGRGKNAETQSKGTKGTRLGIGAKRLMGTEKKPSNDTLHLSSSSPELFELGSEKYRSLVSPVADKTINFIAAKENLRKLLRYQGHIFSDFPSQSSTVPYFWPSDPHSDETTEDSASTHNGIHLVICVHGLDGNSADLRLIRTYIELALPGARTDFLMSERNQPDTFADLDTMTDNLVDEILCHIDIYGIDPERISFVGHSLGNLIIRSALSRPKLAHLMPKMYTFLSLSGPHLGTLYNSSGLVNMGMWFMQKWKKSGSLLQLSLKDSSDPRQSFIYKLSQKSGLEFFKNVLLVSSQQDRYVPYHSSRIELCKSALKDSTGLGGVYAEMVANLLQPLIMKSDLTLVRYDVFHALQNTANSFIGRAAHIAVLDSEIFIEKFVTVAALKYFK